MNLRRIAGMASLLACVRSAWIVIVVAGCSPYDPALLHGGADASSDSATMDSAHDARPPLPDSGNPDGGDDDSGISPNPCHEGLDSDCPMICPEVCNDLDDDCDGKTDEGENQDLCSLPNAEALCTTEGTCFITNCTGGFSNCDDDATNGCEARLDSPEHCVFCFNACTYPNATGQCLNATCAFDACLDGFGDCDGNINNGCELATSTIDNCGACGHVCDPIDNGSVGCIDGACGVATCDNGFGDCDGDPSNGCETNLLETVSDCGDCDNACMFATATASCSAGFCVPGTCSGGRADCDGQPGNACETNILTDEANCGACGGSCSATQLANTSAAECINGKCTPTACAPNYDDCDNDPDNGCETSLRTTTDCGTCGTACGFAHAGASCSTGTCQLGECDALWGNCDGNNQNGCERPTNTLTDCQTCGTACNLSGGTPSCANGVCSIANCTAPMADCDGMDSNGCETNTNSSMAHCGACNSACVASATNGSRTCTAGQCVLSCATGYGNCDGNAANGCETRLNSLSNCGMCGVSCSYPNAAASCATGVCQLGVCNPGFDNCTAAPGCETPLNTLANCNGCGDTCALNNATEACVGGNCNITQCDSGFGNCDGMVGNGCETRLNTLTNCNGCGTTCNLANASETCASQTCRIDQCQGLFANCDNMDANGCERAINTATDCGSCGQPCDYANASESCSTGTCQFGACNSGFDNCDGNLANGCEQALNTTTHCAACNTACTRTNATATCAGGSCAIAQCNSGFATCDNNDANGCETTLGTVTNCASCGNACGVDEMCINYQCRGSFPYTPTNFDPSGITHTAATVINCNTTFNSATGAFTNWCSGQPQPSITTRPQDGGPMVTVLGFDSLTINAGNTLRIEGDKPVILAVYGDATINGSINASAALEVSGPSGATCSTPSGTNDTDSNDGASGGPGGSFGTVGGSGGAGNAGASAVAAAATAGMSSLSPLRGGCPGGRGGRGSSTDSGREGGGAGGAVQLSVAGTLTIGANAVIAAAGGAGKKGGGQEDGGGGGGSGGAILIEGNTLTIASGAWLTANGGSGAGGNATNNTSGVNGSNGNLNNASVVNGGNGGDGGTKSCFVIIVPASGSHSDGGRGGNGSAGSTAAQAGANGSNPSGSCDPDQGGGGGGGGGGAGRIRIRARSTCSFSGGQSPNVVRSDVCAPPEGNCVARTHAGHGYWFCPNNVGWNTANGLCQMSAMRLVRIDNMAENDFVAMNVTANETAIGGTDVAVEGVWRWTNNNDQFWMGDSTGSSVSGRFVRWASGEPNNYNGEHCAYLLMGSGMWNDNNCSSNTVPYVCESQ